MEDGAWRVGLETANIKIPPVLATDSFKTPIWAEMEMTRSSAIVLLIRAYVCTFIHLHQTRIPVTVANSIDSQK